MRFLLRFDLSAHNSGLPPGRHCLVHPGPSTDSVGTGFKGTGIKPMNGVTPVERNGRNTTQIPRVTERDVKIATWICFFAWTFAVYDFVLFGKGSRNN